MSQVCAFCGNKHLTPKTTRYLHQQNDEMLIVEAVPCLECNYCGEQYFDVEVLKRIENDHRQIAEHRRQPEKYLRVAVENFTDIAQL